MVKPDLYRYMQTIELQLSTKQKILLCTKILLSIFAQIVVLNFPFFAWVHTAPFVSRLALISCRLVCDSSLCIHAVGACLPRGWSGWRWRCCSACCTAATGPGRASQAEVEAHNFWPYLRQRKLKAAQLQKEEQEKQPKN